MPSKPPINTDLNLTAADAASASQQPSTGASVSEGSSSAAKAQTDAAQPAPQQQQERQTAPSMDNTAGTPSRAKRSHGTGEQRASSFGFSFPQGVQEAKDEQAAQRSAASKSIHCPCRKGFVSKSPSPEVASQTATASGTSSSEEAAFSLAASSADPTEATKAVKAQPDQARKPIQLPAYEASLVSSVVIGNKLVQDLHSAGGSMQRCLTQEEQTVYGGCLSEGSRLNFNRLCEAVELQCYKVRLEDAGRYQGANIFSPLLTRHF